MKARFTVVGLLLTTLAVFAQESNISPPKSRSETVADAKAPPLPSWTDVGIIDPDRDCGFTFSGNSLTLMVPGAERPHDFAPELKIYNAPRVLNEVQGDFSMQVKIDGKFAPGEESTLPGRTGYTGAGLILIGDSDNCVTLVRATLQHQGREPRGYINFEMRSQGQLVQMGSVHDRPVTSDAPIYLRLERKGKEVLGSVSEDGVKWEQLPAKAVPEDWPEKSTAGVVAISTSTQPFTPVFSEFRREPKHQERAPVQPGAEARQPSEADSATVDLEQLKQKLPEQITPISKEHLASKVPHFYYFEYEGEPQPGKRYWLRVDESTWIERYPDGFQSTFKVLGHTKVSDTEGTIVVKVRGSFENTHTTDDGGLQAFIPDKGSALMHHWYRNSSRGDTEWNDLAPMEGVH